MIKPRRLIEMSRKWRKVAAMGRRRRISLPRHDGCVDIGKGNELIADKGHFIVYTIDRRRFMVPLKYLNRDIFRELFRLSEEEFGLPGNGPITLPCDAVFMEYVISLIQGNVSEDLEKALIISLTTGRCFSSSSFSNGERSNPVLLHGF